MVFSDLKFIYIFLPVFLIIYYLLPKRFKNAFVFLASVAFYTFGTLDRPLYAALFVLAIIITYIAALLMEKFPKHKKLILVLSLIYNFGLLFVFKYEGFLVTEFNGITGLNLPVLQLVLPVGISFYTFQAMSYCIDVYRGTVGAEASFVDYGAYISMFPQLVAGPIVTYPEIKKDLHRRNQDFDSFSEGLKIFVAGLGYKVIIANNLAGVWNDIITIGFESISTPLAWLAAVGYSLQLYFDFYGYSLMAKGMGRMIGFTIPDNFNDPYISVSMTEFWRRWHMTLSGWFREYVYFPLGGSRKGAFHTVINLLIVWTLTGLWHGASRNFILWGLIIFVIIVLEKAGLKKVFDKCRVLGHIYMILLIPLFWSVFAITDMEQLGTFFSRLFPFFSKAEYTVPFEPLKFLRQYGVFFFAGILLSTPLGKKIFYKVKDNLLGAILLGGMFALSIYFLCIGLNDPFLYFRF